MWVKVKTKGHKAKTVWCDKVEVWEKMFCLLSREGDEVWYYREESKWKEVKKGAE